MADGRLVIGTRRYSSWSLRGWLAVRLAGLDVAEEVVPIVGGGPGSTPALVGRTPTGLVPYLEHRGARVWESLSLCEYCAEQAAPGAPPLWPADRAARAFARSVAAEMQGGFGGVRRAYPMILGARATPAARAARATPEADADLARIVALWAEALAVSGGPYLTGDRLGAADAMHAPLVTRALTWGLALPPPAAGYAAALRAHPLVEAWYADAAAEPPDWRRPHYEALLG